MEFTPLIAEPLLSRTKSAEVLSRLWHNIAVKLEDDSGWWAYVNERVRARMDWSEKAKLGSEITIIHGEIKVDL